MDLAQLDVPRYRCVREVLSAYDESFRQSCPPLLAELRREYGDIEIITEQSYDYRRTSSIVRFLVREH